MNLPTKLDPSQVVAIIDSREQTPLDLSPLQTTTSTLTTGDYSIRGLEHVVCVERKSLADLVGCVGSDRERFEKEVQRLLAYPVRILVIESTWEIIESHEPAFPRWRGQITREQVLGSLLGWEAAGLSVHMVGDHERAGKHVSRLLFQVARRRWTELQSLLVSVDS